MGPGDAGHFHQSVFAVPSVRPPPVTEQIAIEVVAGRGGGDAGRDELNGVVGEVVGEVGSGAVDCLRHGHRLEDVARQSGVNIAVQRGGRGIGDLLAEMEPVAVGLVAAGRERDSIDRDGRAGAGAFSGDIEGLRPGDGVVSVIPRGIALATGGETVGIPGECVVADGEGGGRSEIILGIRSEVALELAVAVAHKNTLFREEPINLSAARVIFDSGILR